MNGFLHKKTSALRSKAEGIICGTTSGSEAPREASLIECCHTPARYRALPSVPNREWMKKASAFLKSICRSDCGSRMYFSAALLYPFTGRILSESNHLTYFFPSRPWFLNLKTIIMEKKANVKSRRNLFLFPQERGVVCLTADHHEFVNYPSPKGNEFMNFQLPEPGSGKSLCLQEEASVQR